MKRTKFINNIGEFYKILLDKSKNVKDFHIMNKDMVQVEYELNPDFQPI